MKVTVVLGSDVRSVDVEQDTLLSDAIISTGHPLEQPCAGRGTCQKCKVIAEGHLSPLDDKEHPGLTEAEKAANYRLACRARVDGDVTATLAPIVVYSNKIFQACDTELFDTLIIEINRFQRTHRRALRLGQEVYSRHDQMEVFGFGEVGNE